MFRSRRAVLVLSCGISLAACDQGAPTDAPSSHAPAAAPEQASGEPPGEAPAAGGTRVRTVYVPAYSHLPRGGNKPAGLLSILLSVRNVDPGATVTLTHVDYFDTSGHRVRRYLSAPKALLPLETAEFSVDTLDEVGGSGANFLVYWRGPADAHPLLTEAVMLGHMGAGHVAFTSRGVELDRRPDPASFTGGAPAASPVGPDAQVVR